MEKNDKVKKQNFKKQEKKSEDNKKYKKAEVKEKQIAETKENGRKKHLSRISQHQLKGNSNNSKNRPRKYSKMEEDHQTLELESNISDENEVEIESEEDEDYNFVKKKSNKLSKAPKHVKRFFYQEAKEVISGSEESDEEKSNFSDDEKEVSTVSTLKDNQGKLLIFFSDFQMVLCICFSYIYL